MAEKNTKDNQNSKKKHKWIGIFLIALLLLFIGLAGYYLERDLEPVPDNQIEDSQVLDESDESSADEKVTNGEERETVGTEEDSESEESETKESEKIADSEEEAVSSDIEETDRESEQPAAEKRDEVEQDKIEVGSDRDEAAVEDKETELTADSETEETEVEESSNLDTDETADMETETEQPVSEQKIEGSDEVEQEVESDETALENEDTVETESDIEPESESNIDDGSLDGKDEEEKAVETELEESEVDSSDPNRELEDPSLLDRILSILGLSDSNFSQDLNILVVGLDDEESVAVGTIEADSIMIAKLRPERNKMQLEHIDEDTIYKGQLLRKYHNGDIQLAVEEITETEIDYYVYINYLGFEKVIDELGGVQITLDQEVTVPGLGLNLKAGDNLLSGKEALNFVRWRSSDSIARFERQKILINSVMTKLKSNNILFNVKELYNTIVESYSSIETDINTVLAAEIFNYFRENDELELEFIE